MTCHEQGKTGELASCLQYVSDTWELWSKQHIGYVARVNKTNEFYIATLQVQSWIEQGWSDRDILLAWNQGGRHECIKGINTKYNQPYDSCSYLQKALAYLNE